MAKIVFQRIVQSRQEIGSPEDHLNARVYFLLVVDQTAYEMYADLHQPHGTDGSEVIEVGRPVGAYQGNWNQNEFRELCEKYYRSCTPSIGANVRVSMANNFFMAPMVAELHTPPAGSGAW